MRAAHAKEVEHCGLRLEDRTAAYGADFYAGHRNGDLEVAVDTKIVSNVCLSVRGRWNGLLLHNSDAVRALHHLRRILSCR